MKPALSILWHGSGVYRHISGRMWWPLKKAPPRTTVIMFLFIFLIVGSFISVRWSSASIASNASQQTNITFKTITHTTTHRNSKHPKKDAERLEPSFNCTAGNPTRTCPTNSREHYPARDNRQSLTCPDFFRWIHEDLRPWKATGITKEMVERAKERAKFRLVILNGKAYVEEYPTRVQIFSRDVFTLWGILQLLRRYPGRLPDLELMFDCTDVPIVRSSDYSGAAAPPPLFRYCGDDSTLDIPFPDWSFWGWPEINIKPWESLLKDLKKGNERSIWMKREPYAYWKGNPSVAWGRLDLLKCNLSQTQDWNARLYRQNWFYESRQGYKHSDLASQCTHRYKIYIEGKAWSVSEKYILACDSPTLMVTPRYYDFFTRSLVPLHHYWPIRENSKCRSIKFAVNWGNNHKRKAQAIGKAASNFIQEELKMDYVYDYMFHLLTEYAKLLRYKPMIPQKAIEYCSESVACPIRGLKKKFMMESMVKTSSDSSPCTLPPPLDPSTLQKFFKRKANSIKQVESWERSSS